VSTKLIGLLVHITRDYQHKVEIPQSQMLTHLLVYVIFITALFTYTLRLNSQRSNMVSWCPLLWYQYSIFQHLSVISTGHSIATGHIWVNYMISWCDTAEKRQKWPQPL